MREDAWNEGAERDMISGLHPILLYDGVCGLCNRSVQFILRHDKAAAFRFASLQSSFAAPVLARHGANPSDLDTVYLLTNCEQPGESLLPRSEAVLFVLGRLGGFWRIVALLFRCIPRAVDDWAYRRVAHNRYRIFGRYETCPLPTEDTRARFLDV